MALRKQVVVQTEQEIRCSMGLASLHHFVQPLAFSFYLRAHFSGTILSLLQAIRRLSTTNDSSLRQTGFHRHALFQRLIAPPIHSIYSASPDGAGRPKQMLSLPTGFGT